MSKKELPIIKIISSEDVPYVEMKLEMNNKTHDLLVKWGKESATPEDYVNIAIREGLLNALKEKEKEDENNN